MKKKKILYAILLIVVFFTGVISTMYTAKYFGLFDNNTNGGELINAFKNITVTESDTISSSIDKVYDSVVYVESYNGEVAVGSGSGFVYKSDDKNGYILTNHHVIDSASKVEITNSKGDTFEAKILGSDEYYDVAVLSFDKKYVLQVAILGDSELSKLGDTIFTVGSPLGKTYMGSVTKGILSGKNRNVTANNQYMMEVLQVDAALNSGNSGGPLVNINGEVIGINSMKLVQTGIEGMGFAIPIEIVKTFVDSLEKGEKIERPVLGVTMIDLDNTYQLYKYGINIDKNIKEGVVVVEVAKESPAAVGGIKSGDVIIAIDKTPVKNVAYFRTELYKYKVNDTIVLKVNRNGLEKSLSIKLDTVLENG